MNRSERTLGLAALFLDAGRAHAEAFTDHEGSDPDWAIWYAGYLRDRLNRRLGTVFTNQDLVKLLVEVAEERQVTGGERPWHEFFASAFEERFDPEPRETLALYHYEGCFYCTRVRRAIARLGIDVELRDIFANPEHRRDLIAARGRATVPVLRCTSADADRWMPESADIIRYLERRFGPAAGKTRSGSG